MYPNCHGGSAKAKTDNCGDTYYVCSGNAKVYEYAFIVNSKCKGCYKQYGDEYNFVYDSGRKIYTPDGSYLLSDQSYGCGSIAGWNTQSACESHRSQYYAPSTDYVGTTSMEY